MAAGQLIVNADDFGLDNGRDLGILIGAVLGCITSVSVVVTTPPTIVRRTFYRILRFLNSRVSIGLHVDLTSARLFSAEGADGSGLIQIEAGKEFGDKRDFWMAAHSGRLSHNRIQDEIKCQVRRFIDLFGGPPTHIDGHNHIQVASPEIWKIFRAFGKDLKCRVRLPSDWSVPPRVACPLVQDSCLTCKRKPRDQQMCKIEETSLTEDLIAKMRTCRKADLLLYSRASKGLDCENSCLSFVGTTYGHLRTISHLKDVIRNVANSGKVTELMVHPGLNLAPARLGGFSNHERSRELLQIIIIITALRIKHLSIYIWTDLCARFTICHDSLRLKAATPEIVLISFKDV